MPDDAERRTTRDNISIHSDENETKHSFMHSAIYIYIYRIHT